jgi:hypothetical protein
MILRLAMSAIICAATYAPARIARTIGAERRERELDIVIGEAA